jgi:hypothetical protein
MVTKLKTRVIKLNFIKIHLKFLKKKPQLNNKLIKMFKN